MLGHEPRPVRSAGLRRRSLLPTSTKPASAFTTSGRDPVQLAHRLRSQRSAGRDMASMTPGSPRHRDAQTLQEGVRIRTGTRRSSIPTVPRQFRVALRITQSAQLTTESGCPQRDAPWKPDHRRGELRPQAFARTASRDLHTRSSGREIAGPAQAWWLASSYIIWRP